ncbi:MAG: prepilin-type N-terminal cleavage/methylation domain-containing protein [Gemmatimonadales bacterium]
MKRRMISTGAPCRSGRHGVTLIELLIVIVMIGILSGIAASRLDWQRYRTDAIAREVITEVSKAQRLAVTLQANVRFVVIDPQRIQIHEDVDNNGAVGSGERVRTVVLDEPARLSQGVDRRRTRPLRPDRAFHHHFPARRVGFPGRYDLPHLGAA